MFVEFPIDVLYKYSLVVREVGIKSGGGLLQKIIGMYVCLFIKECCTRVIFSFSRFIEIYHKLL